METVDSWSKPFLEELSTPGKKNEIHKNRSSSLKIRKTMEMYVAVLKLKCPIMYKHYGVSPRNSICAEKSFKRMSFNSVETIELETAAYYRKPREIANAQSKDNFYV